MTSPTRRSARALVMDAGRLLLMRRVRGGVIYFVLPGGGIEPGETAEHACRRELREETGLEARALALIFADDLVEVFRVDGWSGALRLGGPERGRQAPDNFYALVWVAFGLLVETPIQPDALKQQVLQAVVSGGCEPP